MSTSSKSSVFMNFPLPPQEKRGWPWTVPVEAFIARFEDKFDYPCITVVTPSYNQQHFIEETIRSVLLQGYPNLEYIIIDGASTDGSLETIKKYEQHLAYWVSEPDKGQTDAINKGLAKGTGEIWLYLNSDDLLCPNALQRIAKIFQNSDINWVGGASEVFDETGHLGYVVPKHPVHQREYLTPWNRSTQYVFPCSNVCFMRRNLLDQHGFFTEDYHYGMDIEYYLRVVFQAHIKPYLISDVLGRWRWHSESKTLKQGLAYGFREDEVRMAQKYLQFLNIEDQKSVRQEIREQQKWLITRKAMFHGSKGERQQALSELVSQLKAYPDLLKFRPWYGALRRLFSLSR